jgi:hypothetical protein
MYRGTLLKATKLQRPFSAPRAAGLLASEQCHFTEVLGTPQHKPHCSRAESPQIHSETTSFADQPF